ncbi:MAG: RagB/SusD family nutrient uptake outer membrane protein [Tannerella sp.]|nr:RagB/SusD family nutrient uptake outer membrane protein [Tannerella sp.]
MKKYIMYIFALTGLLAGLTACNDAFLDKFPETDITAEGYFKTPKDLETYAYGFYDKSLLYPRNAYDNEPFSDNIAHRNDMGSSEYAMLKGNFSKEVATGWDDWDILRSINFMLANAGRATGNEDEIRHWIGTARYFRAVYYIDKLTKYSNVPWYNKPLETNDPDVYKPSDPRTLVADSIRADLEYASTCIREELGNRTIISRFAALTLLTRFCLYEGTYRKYHPELNLASSANAFLERAATAAEEVMNSGVFSISGNGRAGFSALFTSADLSGNAEIILMAQFEQGKGDGNSTFHNLYGDYALSRSLMESFLMADGQRFTAQPDYDRKAFKDVFADRDPRIYETFATPGFKKVIDATPYTVIIKHGGYEPVKHYPRDLATLGSNNWRMCWTDLPIYRYAEVLLSYAEARAELGTLTQDDLDKSVNLIRARVAMPSMNLAAANADADPVLAAQYPNVSGANRGVILEIRRERRVELALEGQRLQDLHRWCVGELIAQAPQGMYIPGMGAYDLNGDNNPDLAILATPGDLGPISDLPTEQQAAITKYYLSEEGEFFLSEGTNGFMMFTTDRDMPRRWENPKFYYRPIPVTQQVMNPALEQVFGW